MPRIEYRQFEPYSPLDEAELGQSVSRRLRAQPLEQVPPQPFCGAGLYALYYNGPFPAYARLAGTELPIYIGKAAAGSSSFGRLDAGAESTKLLARIRKHSRSIDAAENLDIADFQCRFLVTGDAWIALGEQRLLYAFHPVLWNTVVRGFGNNPQGAGRDLGMRSRWDTLHPGRPNADVLRDNDLSAAEIAELADQSLAARERGEHVEVEIAADEGE